MYSVCCDLFNDNTIFSFRMLPTVEWKKSTQCHVRQRQASSIHAYAIWQRHWLVRIEISTLLIGHAGDLYCIAGDSKRSALWQHKPMFGKWYIVHTLKGVRWQSLRVVEERPLNRSIILMTCEALSGSVQLFVVGQDGS